MKTFCLLDQSEETQIWHLNVYILLAFSTCFLYLNENVLPCGLIRGDTDLTFICIGFNIYHSSSQGSQAVKALKHSIASIVHICTCYINKWLLDNQTKHTWWRFEEVRRAGGWQQRYSLLLQRPRRNNCWFMQNKEEIQFRKLHSWVYLYYGKNTE